MKNLKKLFVSLFYTAAIIFAASPELFARGTGEQKFVRMALSGNPDTLDPHKTAGTLTFQVAKSLYDTLLEPDVQGNLVPALAERWEFQDGDKTLIFYLEMG